MISVIIPYVKDRGYLDEAVASVKAQTYRNYELILQKGNFTQGTNVNKGLAKAKGDYIKILHDDDVLPPNSLQDLHNGINGYDWVCADMKYFGDDFHCPIQGDTSSMNGPPELERMIRDNYIAGGTTLYSKEVLLKIGGYNQFLWTGEEYDLHLRLLKSGFRVNYIPYVVHHYRLHEFNKSYHMGPGEKKERREYIREIASWYR